MEKTDLSCADCAVINCRKGDKRYPDFCVTTHMDPDLKKEALALCREEENNRIMRTAAQVEYEGYRQWCRVREIMEFAKRLGYRKIGIATCVGLIREARIFADLLRKNGFEVFGIACKAGAVPKVDVGIAPECAQIGPNTCNPILQAKILNQEKTDLNVVIGLCVGHDSLFYKYSEAPATTLITKDRVTGHNPAAALYTADSYYKDLQAVIPKEENQ